MAETEIWKDVSGYEGRYIVSTLGHIKNVKRNKLLKPTIDSKGYSNVKLYMNNIQSKTHKVHRLVASAFLSNPDNKPQINHKDENRTNDRVDNLEWCTNKYNCNYGNHSKHLSKPILQFDKNGNYIRKWNGASEAGKALNICIQSIQKCCKLKRFSAGGYVWKYEKGGI